MERTRFSLAAGAALVLATLLASAVLALRADAQGAGYSAPLSNAPAPMVVSINANGNALIRGTVISHAANSLTLETWGGTWTILGGGMPAVANGDFVGADGTVSASAPMTINANHVRDWSAPLSFGTNIPSVSRNDLLYSGIASGVNINNGTFMLTEYGTGVTYQVFLRGGGTLWDYNRNTIALGNIQNGDTIRLDGSATGNSIITDVVRDLSR